MTQIIILDPRKYIMLQLVSMVQPLIVWHESLSTILLIILQMNFSDFRYFNPIQTGLFFASLDRGGAPEALPL